MLLGPTKYSSSPTLIGYGRYANGQTALLALDDDGSTALKLTVNLEELGAPEPGPNHVWLKTWSENEGVAEAAAKAGIVVLTETKFAVNGYGSVAVLAELTDAAIAERATQPR